MCVYIPHVWLHNMYDKQTERLTGHHRASQSEETLSSDAM